MKSLTNKLGISIDSSLSVRNEVIDSAASHYQICFEHQIIWIEDGKGTLIIDGKLQSFATYDFFFIYPHQPYIIKGDDDSAIVEIILISFELYKLIGQLLLLPELKTIQTFLRNNQYGFRISNKHTSSIYAVIKLLSQAQGMALIIHFLQLFMILVKLSIKCIPFNDSISMEHTPIRSIRIKMICEFIKNNFRQNINLQQIAEMSNLTPQAFCRYFKKSTGKTLMSYINEIRVNEVCKMLINGPDECISMVAYNCGFNSITNFNRVFRSITGMSPKYYISLRKAI